MNALRSQEVGEGKLALQLEFKFCPGTDTGSEPREAGGTCTCKDVYTCTCNMHPKSSLCRPYYMVVTARLV